VPEWRTIVSGEGEPQFILYLNVDCHGDQPTAKPPSVSVR
jgi:hypothetical protein